jgi:hypothetical protein
MMVVLSCHLLGALLHRFPSDTQLTLSPHLPTSNSQGSSLMGETDNW